MVKNTTKKKATRKRTAPRTAPSRIWDTRKAEMDYIQDITLKQDDIAKMYNVSSSTVEKTANTNNWGKKRDKYQEEMYRIAMKFSKDRANRVLTKQERDAERLRDIGIRMLNRAWKAVAGTDKQPNISAVREARALINDSHKIMRQTAGLPDFITGVDFEGKKQEQTPLIQFNINSALDRARAINSGAVRKPMIDGEVIDAK